METSKLTSFIKLKFDNDFDSISQTMTYLIKNHIGELFVLDANASWSTETTRKIIEFIS